MYSSHTQGNVTYLLAPAAVQFQPEWFLPSWWQSEGAVTGQAQGRGTTWFVQRDGQPLVLRHYYRGGLLGRWLHDRYLYTGITRSRVAREFSLLQHLQTQGLPVPVPWAARITRHGCYCRMDLLLERIPHARDLVNSLRSHPLQPQHWQQVGQTLQQFHAAGVYHADLNGHNILLDTNGKVWVIDFDRGQLRQPGPWQQANLQRLQRSLHKEADLYPGFHWQPDDWQALLKGYDSQQAATGSNGTKA